MREHFTVLQMADQGGNFMFFVEFISFFGYNISFVNPMLDFVKYYPNLPSSRSISIGYQMSGEVISVLSLEGRYYNCHERDTIMILVTRVIQLISPSQSCDNFFITYLCLYQASNRENTVKRSECVFHLLSGNVY